MKRIHSGNIVSIVILSTLFFLQVFSPFVVSAATDWTTAPKGTTTGVSVTDVVNPQTISSVISCTGIVNRVLGSATNFISAQINSLIGKGASKAVSAVASITSVPTSDKGATAAINATSTQSVTNTSNAIASDVQAKCLDGIAVALARTELEKVTRSTLNWVATGFSGDPLFVQNTSQFMNNITNNILSQETKWFADATNKNQYPYGQTYAISSINASRSSTNFDASVSQNLTNYLAPGATPQSFAGDFSQGGWGGWLALTQNPVNNPLGFTMVVSQHTADLQAEQTANLKAQLAASGGYPDQKKCAVYALTEPRAQAKLASLQQAITTAQSDQKWACDQAATATDPSTKQLLTQSCNDAAAVVATAQANLQAANVTSNQDCAVWKTVTPGSAIRDKVTTTLNSPETQLELVKSVNDALTYLFTALLSRFRTQGLSSLATGTFDDVSGGLSSGNLNGITDSYGNIVSSNNGSSNGSDSSGAFDITVDLGGVIDTQKNYLNEITKASSIAQGVLPALGALDYCIPGPNPNWLDLNQDAIDAAQQAITDKIAADADDATQLSADMAAQQQLESNISDYQTKVDAAFGTSSPMQDASLGNTSYLPIAPIALNLTKNIGTIADTITTTLAGYKQDTIDVSSDIYQLNIIKGKVDVIVAAAKARRDADRAKQGLPAYDKSCSAN